MVEPVLFFLAVFAVMPVLFHCLPDLIGHLLHFRRPKLSDTVFFVSCHGTLTKIETGLTVPTQMQIVWKGHLFFISVAATLNWFAKMKPWNCGALEAAMADAGTATGEPAGWASSVWQLPGFPPNMRTTSSTPCTLPPPLLSSLNCSFFCPSQ